MLVHDRRQYAKKLVTELLILSLHYDGDHTHAHADNCREPQCSMQSCTFATMLQPYNRTGVCEKNAQT